MIRFLDGKFEASRDRYGWTLIHWYQGKDREGNPKLQRRETYHATLDQARHAAACRGHRHGTRERADHGHQNGGTRQC